MPLNVRSEAVNQLTERRAARVQVNKTETVRIALGRAQREAAMFVGAPAIVAILTREPESAERGPASFAAVDGLVVSLPRHLLPTAM